MKSGGRTARQNPIAAGVEGTRGCSACAIGAALALIALVVLAIAWERWLAPLRPGGSALVLKALPLAFALPGLLRRRIYTFQWASMLILFYFMEGVVRGMSDAPPSAWLGWIQTALSLLFLACALAYVAPFKRAAKAAQRRSQADAAAPDSERREPGAAVRR